MSLFCFVFVDSKIVLVRNWDIIVQRYVRRVLRTRVRPQKSKSG